MLLLCCYGFRVLCFELLFFTFFNIVSQALDLLLAWGHDKQSQLQTPRSQPSRCLDGSCFDIPFAFHFQKVQVTTFLFFFHMLGPFRMAHVRWVLMCFAALCNVAGVASQQRMCRRSTWCPPSCQCELHVNEKWMRWQARRGEEM